VTLPDILQRLTAALPANPEHDGPIGVEAGDLRELLEADHFPQRYIVGVDLATADDTDVVVMQGPSTEVARQAREWTVAAAPDTEGAAQP
jgi:phage terminase large subunit-like protein